ncbi:MAG: MBL fold metallo-hydrolase, partial [Pseudomonadota bacterium]
VTLEGMQRRGVPVRKAQAGDRLAAGEVEMTVLHPPAVGPEGKENHRSLVLRVRHRNHTLLLTGDLEGPGLARVLEMPADPIDVLMAPHHGSKTSNTPELARWAKGCDLLLAECSLPEGMAIDIHLTPEQAGDLAQEAGARRLVLTHFYPPVENSDPARAAASRFTGPVTAAVDGDRFTI